MNFVFLILSLSSFVSGKVYKRCELARELKTVHKAPVHQLSTWVCIAEHESQYKTDAVGRLGEKGTADHGIFQINDKYWCSPVGQGRACGLSCSQLEDDDITDDFICAQKIYKEHKILSGDGFNAWAVYQPHCKGSKAAKYLKECFTSNNSSKPTGTGRPIWQNPYSSQDGGDNEFKKMSAPPQKNVVEEFSTNKPVIRTPFYGTSTTQRPTRPSSTSIRSDFSHSTTIRPMSTVLGTSSTFSKPITNIPVFTVKTRLSILNPSINSNSFSNPNRLNGIRSTTNRPLNFDTRSYLGFSPEPLESSSGIITSDRTTRAPLSIQPVFIFNGMKWY